MFGKKKETAKSLHKNARCRSVSRGTLVFYQRPDFEDADLRHQVSVTNA